MSRATTSTARWPLCSNGGRGGLGVRDAAVQPQDLLGQQGGGFAVLVDGPYPLGHDVTIVRVDHIEHVLAEDLLGAAGPEYLQRGRVEEDQSALLVDVDRFRRQLHELAIALLAPAEGLLGPPLRHGRSPGCSPAVPAGPRSLPLRRVAALVADLQQAEDLLAQAQRNQGDRFIRLQAPAVDSLVRISWVQAGRPGRWSGPSRNSRAP